MQQRVPAHSNLFNLIVANCICAEHNKLIRVLVCFFPASFFSFCALYAPILCWNFIAMSFCISKGSSFKVSAISFGQSIKLHWRRKTSNATHHIWLLLSCASSHFIYVYECMYVFFASNNDRPMDVFIYEQKAPIELYIRFFSLEAILCGMSGFLAQLNYKTVWPSWQHLWH